MRLLVVDDHVLVAQMLAGLLTQRFPLDLVGICGSVAQAVPLIAAAPPDLLLLDVGLPGEDWVKAADHYRQVNPQGALIMVTGLGDLFERPQWLAPMLLAVVQKTDAWFELEVIVAQWLRQRWDIQTNMQCLCEHSVRDLSPRERRVFEALGQGFSNRQIAQALGLSLSTVDTYRKSISAKLGVSGAELVRQAVLNRCLPSLSPAQPLPS